MTDTPQEKRSAMDRVAAIKILIREGQRERLTKVGLRLTRQACIALQLTDAETLEIETALEYRHGDLNDKRSREEE